MKACQLAILELLVLHVHVHVLCMYVCMYVYMYVCMYVCMDVRTCVIAERLSMKHLILQHVLGQCMSTTLFYTCPKF